jgi:hypothetical protein
VVNVVEVEAVELDGETVDDVVGNGDRVLCNISILNEQCSKIGKQK